MSERTGAALIHEGESQGQPQPSTRLNVFALPSQTTVIVVLIVLVVLATVSAILLNGPLSALWLGTPLVLLLALRRLMAWPEDIWRRYRPRPADPRFANLERCIQQLATVQGVTPPRLYISQDDAPLSVVGGLRRRYILTGERQGLDLLARLNNPDYTREAEAAILHELQHIRRNDNLLLGFTQALLNIVAQIVGGLLFCLTGLFSLALIARPELIRLTPEDVAARLDTASTIPGAGHLLLTLIPPAIWAQAQDNLRSFDLSLVLFFLLVNLQTIILATVALLVLWRALLRIRELYADAAVAHTQGVIAPLVNMLIGGAGSAGRRRQRLLGDAHPAISDRIECLQMPECIYRSWWRAALLIGTIGVLFDLIFWNSSAIRQIGLWPLHVPVLACSVLTFLWLLPRIVLGHPPWSDALRMVGLISGFYGAILLLTSLIVLVILLVSPGEITTLARMVTSFVAGVPAFPPEDIFASPADLALNAVVLNVIELPLLFGLCAGTTLLYGLLARRMLRWYAYPRAAQRLIPTLCACVGCLAVGVGLALVVPITDLWLGRLAGLMSPGHLIGLLVGLLAGAAGLIGLVVGERRYAGLCPACKSPIPGAFALGRCCPTCAEPLHPWLGVAYDHSPGR